MPYITSGKAAKKLGISKRTLFRWEKEGKIKGVRDGVLKVRLYDENYVQETKEILELNEQEEEHLKKLPTVMENVKKYIFVNDVEEVRRGAPTRFMDIEEASKAFDNEETWMKKHNEILKKLSSYPKQRLRELFL